LWIGCTKIAPGCKNCYAEKQTKRFMGDFWGPDKDRKITKSAFPVLSKLQRSAEKNHEHKMVFVGSMMDIFENNDNLNDIRFRLFESVENYPNLHFQFLTKRPEEIGNLTPATWDVNGAPDNVWFGVSASLPEEAVENTGLLIRNTPVGSNLFMSIEPMLDEFSEGTLFHIMSAMDWVIVGGESGPKARNFKPDWARKVITTARVFDVPVFVKQMGTTWAIKAGLRKIDPKGGDMSFWPGYLQVRENMPIKIPEAEKV